MRNKAMSSATATDIISAENQRILDEYGRRSREITGELYATWQPATALMVEERRRIAIRMMYKAGVFPTAETKCLEVGYGGLGWLGELIMWGVKETSISGIELHESRAKVARELLPVADLRVGDAADMPWEDSQFDLIIASTVFTSILSDEVRSLVAVEIKRVLAPGGALLWYDFKMNNPRNPHVRRVTKKEVRILFPGLLGEIRSVTLAPPISRFVAPISWTVATVLSAVPFLRTHLIAVLKKPG